MYEFRRQETDEDGATVTAIEPAPDVTRAQAEEAVAQGWELWLVDDGTGDAVQVQPSDIVDPSSPEAVNYVWSDSAGVHVSQSPAMTGANMLLDSLSLKVRKAAEVLAEFTSNAVNFLQGRVVLEAVETVDTDGVTQAYTARLSGDSVSMQAKDASENVGMLEVEGTRITPMFFTPTGGGSYSSWSGSPLVSHVGDDAWLHVARTTPNKTVPVVGNLLTITPMAPVVIVDTLPSAGAAIYEPLVAVTMDGQLAVYSNGERTVIHGQSSWGDLESRTCGEAARRTWGALAGNQ